MVFLDGISCKVLDLLLLRFFYLKSANCGLPRQRRLFLSMVASWIKAKIRFLVPEFHLLATEVLFLHFPGLFSVYFGTVSVKIFAKLFRFIVHTGDVWTHLASSVLFQGSVRRRGASHVIFSWRDGVDDKLHEMVAVSGQQETNQQKCSHQDDNNQIIYTFIYQIILNFPASY